MRQRETDGQTDTERQTYVKKWHIIIHHQIIQQISNALAMYQIWQQTA